MIRVVLLVSALDGSGPARVMSMLAQELPGTGVAPLLAATHGPTSSPQRDEALAAGIEVVHLGMRSILDPRGPLRLRALVRRWRPDVVHTRTTRADVVGRAAVDTGAAVVNNVVNLYPDDCLAQHGPVLGRAVMAVARATARATRLFVANAEAVARNTGAAFRVPEERMRVVYDGIRVDEWAGATAADLTAWGIGADEVVCLTVARLHEQKGLEDLVDAAARVVRTRPDVRFVVAGDGPGRRGLEARIDGSALRERVVLLGHRRDIPNLLARARLFVLPSRFEGLPAALIEAMAAGRATVATAVAGVPELVQDGVTGWLVPAATPVALASAVERALGRDLAPMEAAGARRARERFAAPTMAHAFAAVYEEALTGA